MASVSPARKAAFALLKAVERGRAHSDDLLRTKSIASLSEADRNLATTLVLGVLRWQIRLDHQLRPLLKHPNAKLDAEVSIALRLGAFQLLHLDRIPARAAIDESVELTKQTGHRFAAGMVNAVLRKVALAKHVDFAEGSASELSVAQAHPAWMVDRWFKNYGLEAARAICKHGQSHPTHTTRIDTSESEAELIASGIHLEPGALLTAARIVVSGDITSTAAYREGRVRLQDEGSQLIAEIAGRGERILDCCAAPGGKTLIMAELNPLAHIVACDSNEQRFEQLGKRLAAVGERVECRLTDATLLADDGAYDLVLADVPCSGTGTLGRNPEIRHRLRLDDLPRQAERQKAILHAALRAARPGGRVIYSTCSLEPEENEEVVAAVLHENKSGQQLSLDGRLNELRDANVLTAFAAERLASCVTTEGSLRLLPGLFKSDGFFIAVIEKTS